MFSVTRFLANDLADLGASYSRYSEDEGIICSWIGDEYGIEDDISYHVNKGDLSDYMMLVQLI